MGSRAFGGRLRPNAKPFGRLFAPYEEPEGAELIVETDIESVDNPYRDFGESITRGNL